MNQNPAVLTNFTIINTPTSTLNGIHFLSAPANATQFNLTAATSSTLTLNEIIVAGNVPNPASVGAAAANNAPARARPLST